MAAASIQKVSHAAAVLRYLASNRLIDPETGQRATPDAVASAVAAGVPFDLQIPAGRLLMVLQLRGSQLWIQGAVGTGSGDLTLNGLQFAEATARKVGCTSVGFQTARRGLVRKATRLGYRADGSQLTKALP